MVNVQELETNKQNGDDDERLKNEYKSKIREEIEKKETKLQELEEQKKNNEDLFTSRYKSIGYQSVGATARRSVEVLTIKEREEQSRKKSVDQFKKEAELRRKFSEKARQSLDSNQRVTYDQFN